MERKLSALKKLLMVSATSEKEKKIGGIPVLIDNARFAAGSGNADAYTTDKDYFITGWYDTGSNGSKSYTFGSVQIPVGESIDYPYGRWFNDKDSNSVDFWSANLSSVRTFSTEGQFILATVYKQTASKFYLFNNTADEYIFKGNEVE